MSTPGDVTLTLNKVGTITLHHAVVDVEDGTGTTGRQFTISGGLLSADVVNLLVSVGGFDKASAEMTAARVLGVSTLPETIAFEVTATGSETDD